MKKVVYTSKENARFCKNLALLLHAGLPLSDSLYLMGQEEGLLRKQEYEQLGNLLDQGEPLSAAMEKSGSFPVYTVGMVRIGEQTGQLEAALTMLASFYEIRHRTESHLREVLTYPAVLMAMMLAVIAVLLVKVLPVFEEVYISLGSQLTGISAVLLQLGQALSKLSPVLLAVAAGILLIIFLVYKIPPARKAAVTFWKTHFGDRGIFRKFNNAQFAGALAMGFHSGLPLSQSMLLAEQLLMDSPGAVVRIKESSRQLSEGISLITALQETQLLSASACRMLSVGLRSGSAESVMDELAAQMLEEAQDSLDTKISRLEPAMVLLCSVLVGIILLSVMLPLMHTLSAIG